jgi:hypothetical protein
MENRLILNVGVLFLLCFNFSGISQKILLLEVRNQVDAIRFMPGDKLIYKTAANREWNQQTIERLLPETNIILFDNGMINVDEIKMVRVYTPVARAAGKLLTGFGMTWLIFGGVLTAAGREPFSWTNLAIGGAAVGLGQLFMRVAGKRNYILDQYTRLRLVDISFPEPQTEQTRSSAP